LRAAVDVLGMERPERALTYSGAAILAGAGAVSLLELLLPGGPRFSPIPALVALALAPLLLAARVPRPVLFWTGPLTVALIAASVATAKGYSDAAILYAWPVLWTASFYSSRRTAICVAAVAVAHGAALLTMPSGVGNPDRFCVVVVSVTVVAMVVRSLAARNRRLVLQAAAEARIDPLTGLLNRRGLDERFASELARAGRDGTELAVVALDLDHFKQVNDTYGHDAGDRALCWLASVLSQQTRGADVIARTGGEEFLLVLPGTSAGSAFELAERLRESVAEHAPFRLTISIGVAAEEAPDDAGALTAAADRALYAAKRDGRNRTRTEPSGARAS